MRHLSRCRCPQPNGGRTGHHARFGVKLFYRYLIQRGTCPHRPVENSDIDEPALVTAFRDCFRTRRGAAEPTLRLYCRDAADLLHALGDDVSQWNAEAVRSFALDRASQGGAGTTQKLITSLRAFLRYLSFRGDAVVHCRTEKEAQEVRAATAARLKDCGLELHPEKTKIVYLQG